MSGFHGTFATGVACQQGTLTPSDTWSCPIWDLQLFSCSDHWHSIVHYTSFWHLSVIWLFTYFDVITEYRFLEGICNGCGMPTGDAYPSGHLVPSPIVGLACAPIVETRFLELAMSLLDFSPRIPLGTFLILLVGIQCPFNFRNILIILTKHIPLEVASQHKK